MDTIQSRCTAKLDFAQFLLDRGIIGKEQAERIRDRASHERAPIGQLFITQGKCSVRQVMNLVAMQEDCPGVRLGELAVRSGYITTLELEQTLKYQKEYRFHQIEVALQERIMVKEQLYRQVIAYVRFIELRTDVDDEDLVEQAVSRVA